MQEKVMNVIPFQKAAQPRAEHFRIHRYPTALIDRVQLGDGRRVTIRPVLPQDAALHQAFVAGLSPATRYNRFHGPVASLPQSTLRYMTEVDYVAHMAFVATTIDDLKGEIQVAEARWVRRAPDEGDDVADFALVVADRWQRAGLGSILLGMLADTAAAQGIRRLSGDVLADNEAMCRLMKHAGWRLTRDRTDPRLVVAWLALPDSARERRALAA
jgi:acetyltransferase